MSPLVKTKRQANLKNFKRFGGFKELVVQKKRGPTRAKKTQFTQELVK
jgi:hypothetical protein